MVHIDRDDQLSAVVSYRVAPWRRDQGVATRALGAVTRWAFDLLGLERLELPHSVANPASCRVAEKCGVLLEGLGDRGTGTTRDAAGTATSTRRWPATWTRLPEP